MKRDCTSNSFKNITNFYCGFGHRAINCKKPKFDNKSSNSKMFRGTILVGRRSNEGNNGAGNNIVCYKYNNFAHIAKN